MFLSLSSFLNAGTAYTSVTLSGRLVTLGYGLFILICIATFTAETATALISKSLVKKAGTIEDALEASKKICYSSGMKTEVEQRYPRMKQLGISLDTDIADDFILAQEAGKCDYSIVGERWVDDFWERGEYCNFAFIGTTILSFPAGYYVSEELRPYISWSVSHERSAGAWSKVEMEYETKTLCRSTADAEGDSDGNIRLNANDMLGAFLVFLIALVFASFIRCCEFACCGPSEEDKELRNELQTDAKNLEATLESSANRVIHRHSDDTSEKTLGHVVELDETRENVLDRATRSDQTEEETRHAAL